jgi:transposase
MVLEMRPELDTERAAIKMVAARLGVRSAETVRKWVRQAEAGIAADQGGEKPAVPAAAAEYAEYSPAGNGRDRPADKDDGKSDYGAINQLNSELLKERISDLFSGGYLTLIAIVQGVTLTILLEAVKHEVLTGQSAIHRLTAASQALGVFTAIVIITHRYFLLTAASRWRPTPIDTLLTYALGASEALAASMIGVNSAWWIALSALFLITMASFVHTLLHDTEALYGDDLFVLYAGSRSATKWQLINCSALMPICLCIGFLSIYSAALPALFYLLAPYAIIAPVCVVETYAERNRRRIYATYGFPRWRGRSKEKDIRKDEAPRRDD